MDGVTATVNYSTEKAKVTFDDGSVPTTGGDRRSTGYTAALPTPPSTEPSRPR